MSILTDCTDLLTLGSIARRIPGARGAKRLHPATLARWIVKGTKATDGTVVRLAATRVGFRWLVRATDLDAFFERLSAPADAPPAPPAPSATARKKAVDAAAEALKRMGA
jgi:hypothetical protein